MKILQIVDVPYWAIGHLSKKVVELNPHFEWKTIYVHPKHVEEHLAEVAAEIDWADIVDFEYWNTAQQLLGFLPQLKDKKLLLTHHNEKDLLSADWVNMNKIVCQTKRGFDILEAKYPGKVKLIPLSVDPGVFTFTDKLPNKKVVGYVGRVVPWKGLKELAQACFDLGYTLKIMGKFDKPDYWNQIPPEQQVNMDLSFMDCTDEERPEFYKSLDIYVGNSGPGRETGPLGLLEAMASGVPVLTTPAGIAADIIEDHENGIITPFNDFEQLKNNLLALMSNEDLKSKIRKNGWNTVKNYTEERRAWEYEKVFHEVYSLDPLVSVIIPTTPDRKDQVDKILAGLTESDYKHFEVIVAIDREISLNSDLYLDWCKRLLNFPVKFLCTGQDKVYGLAMARNIAAIEAQGKYLMFCDSRLLPDPAAMLIFVETAEKQNDKHKKVWFYGTKGTGRKTFVENFSFIRRDHFINAGMFNERIDRYGGMSQEVRARFLAQGFECEYIEDAIATQITGSHLTLERRADIVASKLKLWKMGMS